MLPFIADMPPMLQERVVCSIVAAVKYEIPANLMLAVAEKEGGKPGQWVRNTNGTHDIGPMQFNTVYLQDLAKYGITSDDVAASGCYSYDLAAWRIRMHIRNDKGDLWTKAANYHSRTPRYNSVYRADLIDKAVKWADWLEVHLSAQDLTQMTQLTATSPAQAPQAVTQPTTAANSYRPNEYVPRSITFSSSAQVSTQ